MFRWSFVVGNTLAIIFMILAIVGFKSTWVIAFATAGGIAGTGTLLNELRKNVIVIIK